MALLDRLSSIASTAAGAASRQLGRYAARGQIRASDARIQAAASAYRAARMGREPAVVPGSDTARRNFPSWLPHDRKSQELLRSEDARYGRVTAFVGEATANQPYYTASGLHPRAIASTHVEVDTVGRMIDKADMDHQVLRRDSHLSGVDRARRVAVSGREVRVEAADPSELAMGLRDLGEALIDDVDSFDSSIFELLKANACGYGFGEAIFEPKALRVPALGMRIPGAWPQQIVEVHNRNFRFHPITDIPALEMSAGKFVDVFDPAYKFLYHWTDGDGPKRQRGHLYQTIYLHLIKHEAVIRWAHCLDFWGIPVPYALLDEEKFQNVELKAKVIEQLVNAGLGDPFVGLAGGGEDLGIKFTPTPPGLDARGMHAALIGWANSEQSKIVQHETLTTEVGGGPGSYKLSETHENTKAALVRMDERRMRATVRSWLREVFKLNMPALCAAFRATPAEILGALPRVYWLVENDLTADKRLDMMLKGAEAGFEIDARQGYRQFGWDRARKPGDAIRGKAITIPDGAQSVGEVAASRGVDNPKDEAPAPAGGASAARAPSQPPSAPAGATETA